jgi:hypothetical protein
MHRSTEGRLLPARPKDACYQRDARTGRKKSQTSTFKGLMFKYVKRKSSITVLTSCVSRQERDDMQARLAQMAQWNSDDTVFTARHTAEAQTIAD